MSDSGRFGDFLRSMRQSRGLSQIELATAIGIARSTLAGFENGFYMPGRETLNALADFLKVPLDDFRKATTPRAVVTAQLVDDPDELAWLGLWRRMTERERAQLLMRAYIPALSDKPETN